MKRLLTSSLLGLLLAAVLTASAYGKPLRVYILAGQSNMEGKAKMSLVEYQAEQPATRDLFKHWRKDGKWIERDDVWIKFLDRQGKLFGLRYDGTSFALLDDGEPLVTDLDPDAPGRTFDVAVGSAP